jgi:ABC-type nickel/cobalt efflux system permease component RcnA
MAAAPPNDLISLLQKLVELTVRLISGRIELATAQVRDGAARAGHAAAWALGGAVALSVGAALAALAAVEVLAPRVGGRAFALALVAAPLVTAGAWAFARASRRRIVGAAADQANGHRDERQHEQDVDPGADRVTADHAEQPEHEQERAHQPQHRSPPRR